MRLRVALAGAALALAALLAATPGANGARDLRTGFADRLYSSDDEAERASAFDATVDAGAQMVRINVPWRSVAGAQPAAPRDPADPAYDFAAIDRAVTGARARGLEVLLTIYSAPDFAVGPNPPAGAAPGTWKPDPGAFADFATAVATRYSGSYAGLPAVRDYQAWNEPNLPNYLAPQYEGQTAFAVAHYRRMLNAFAAAVDGVAPANRVVTAGTAPYGDDPGGQRTRPLSFWRGLLCLDGRKALRATECPERARFDIAAHHPINTSGGPGRSALHPDDASTPDFDQFARIVRAAERRKTIDRRRHPLWATELWWDSDPPDTTEGVAVAKHARWIEQALFSLWSDGASAVVNLQLRDDPFDPSNAFAENTTGVLFADGTPKPAFTAMRFPFVAERVSKRKLLAWGRAPSGGRLTIERRRGRGWRRVKTVRVRGGRVFTTRLSLRGTQRLRARVGGEASLVWAQR